VRQPGGPAGGQQPGGPAGGSASLVLGLCEAKASTYLVYITDQQLQLQYTTGLIYYSYMDTDRFLTLPLNLNYYYIQDSDWIGNDLTSVVWPA
jgi:hypothetical protein